MRGSRVSHRGRYASEKLIQVFAWRQSGATSGWQNTSMVRLFALAITLSGAVGVPLLAPASAGASVTFGHARISVLTPAMARIEYAADLAFDDRPSTFIVNRTLPVPAYTVTYPNATCIRVATTDMAITYVEAPLAPAPPRIIGALYGGGVTYLGGYNIPQYHNGAPSALTVDACAALCAVTVGCEGAYFDQRKTPQCSLKAGVLSVRFTGGGNSSWTPVSRAAGPFTRETLRVESLGGSSTSWSPGDPDAALNGTFAQLDCGYGDMSAIDCVQEWWAMRMQRGLVSDGGVVAVDDSWTLRIESDAVDGGWAAARAYAGGAATPDNTADIYVSAYGARRDYVGALGAWAAISGAAAMPRRAYLGVAYSRNWRYDEAGVVGPDGVIEGYANHSLPLSLFVLDMDWHIEPGSPCSSWGQYDWNTTLFADPGAFLEGMHNGSTPVARPLEVSLNFHMESGVDVCAERYSAVAAALGLPTGGNKTIPCNFFNSSFVAALHEVYFAAAPLNAVDVVWADWFGCGIPAGSVVSAGGPSWRSTLVRPFIMLSPCRPPPSLARPSCGRTFCCHAGMPLPRRAGAPCSLPATEASARSVSPFVSGCRMTPLFATGELGSPPASAAFSGDTYQHEAALDFLVDTTPTAANALLPYWTHDVGGNMNFTDAGEEGGGKGREGEVCSMSLTDAGAPGDWDAGNFTGLVLMLRWFQAAVTQPIFRTHCDVSRGVFDSVSCCSQWSTSPAYLAPQHCVRTIWSFPAIYTPLADTFALRHALGAYLYTAARAAYDTGVSPMRPMYYAFPQDPLAHNRSACSRQYMVGDRVLAAPFTTIAWAGNGGAADNSTSRSVWLPAGSAWAAWAGSSSALSGSGPLSQVVSRGGFDFTPLFVPYPALLPLVAPEPVNVDRPSPDLVWTYWPPFDAPDAGPSESVIYEDDGVSTAYEQPGAGMRVEATAAYGPGGNLTLVVHPPNGTYAGVRSSRSHSLQVRGCASVRSPALPPPLPSPNLRQVRGWAQAALPDPLAVMVNGVPVSSVAEGSDAPGWYRVVVGDTAGLLVRPLGCLVVNAGPQPMDGGVRISIVAAAAPVA